MSDKRTDNGTDINAGEIIDHILPALNVLRSIHLDVVNHPGCPFTAAAEKATDKLLQLMALAKNRDEGTP